MSGAADEPGGDEPGDAGDAGEPGEPGEEEIAAAAQYWLSQLRTAELDGDQGERFAAELRAAMRAKFRGHWHAGEPHRGQAFRATAVDRGGADALLSDAAARAGLGDFRRRLPADFDVVLWCDPGSVAVRYNNTNRAHAVFGNASAPSFVRARDRRSSRSYIDRTWSQSGAPDSPSK